MGRLLFFHDFASPFCRLALDTVLEAAERTGLDVRPVPFELRPAPEPLPSSDDPTMADEMRTAAGVADEWGVVLRPPPVLPRTRKAHEAVVYAIEHHTVGPVLRGIYDALWTDGRDIARIDVLADIGQAAGLEREPLHVALGTDVYQPDMVREMDAAAGAGITAVPVVQVGSERVSGAVLADELVAWIEENG